MKGTLRGGVVETWTAEGAEKPVHVGTWEHLLPVAVVLVVGVVWVWSSRVVLHCSREMSSWKTRCPTGVQSVHIHSYKHI